MQRFQNMLPRYFRERGGQENIIQAGARAYDLATTSHPGLSRVSRNGPIKTDKIRPAARRLSVNGGSFD
jgi:hypothetical protein